MRETRSQGLMRLKENLLAVRGWRCEVCGEQAPRLHLHHGVVSQNDIVGWQGAHRKRIDVAYNCFLVCDLCHLNKPLPSREWFWKKAAERYGEPAVLEWYDLLPFKGPRPNYATSGVIKEG